MSRGNDLVLVFECEEAAARRKDLHYRFVVFNEGPEKRTWDDALFVVNYKKADGYVDVDPNDNVVPSGLGAFHGDYPISYFGNYDFPGLALASGESTTHAGALSGRMTPADLPYDVLITALFKGGERERAKVLIQTPPVTVWLE